MMHVGHGGMALTTHSVATGSHPGSTIIIGEESECDRESITQHAYICHVSSTRYRIYNTP